MASGGHMITPTQSLYQSQHGTFLPILIPFFPLVTRISLAQRSLKPHHEMQQNEDDILPNFISLFWKELSKMI